MIKLTTPETDALECAFALLKCSPIGNPENSSEYGRAAYILSKHCQGKEDVSEAAMRIFAERINELERERDEAQKEFSSIHRWVERNHADGFIDSLTYLQNLERVTDCWYDRIDAIESDARRFVRERDEAREKLNTNCEEISNKLIVAMRERDEARDDATNYYAKIGELKQERDEARGALHNYQCDAVAWEILTKAKHERDRLREAVIQTLNANRHLADGDNCTLTILKSAVPEWK